MSDRRRRMLWSIPLIVVLLIVAFVASSLATDRPQFCPTCHEMKPYNDAWATGAHHEVWCIDCHVEPGLPARFAHKFVALKEVYAHFAGDTSFPRATPPDVPSERCIRCHPDVPDKLKSGFPHGVHAEKGACAQCHYDTGHSVSETALQAAGIFAPGVAPKRLVGETAQVGSGKANLPGHKTVVCSNCHDMAGTPCEACHQVPSTGHPAVANRPCSQCHRSGASFVFSHPSAGEHNWRSRPCAKCHPASYDQVYCTCHKGKPPRD